MVFLALFKGNNLISSGGPFPQVVDRTDPNNREALSEAVRVA